MKDSTIAIIIVVIMAIYVIYSMCVKFKPHFEVIWNCSNKYLVFSYYNLAGNKINKVLFKYAK